MRNALTIIAIFCFYIQADTIIDFNSSTIVTGIWTKDKSPYTVNGPVRIQNLEIQAGVKVIFNTDEIHVKKGFFNIIGTENDSITMTTIYSSGQSRIYIFPENISDTVYLDSKYVRYTNIFFDCSYPNAANLTVEHSFFNGYQAIHGNINMVKIKNTTAVNTLSSAIIMTDGKEINISCCTFNNFNSLDFAHEEKIVIDSCLFTNSKIKALKFVNNNRILLKNSIITNCSSDQGSGLSLESNNHYSLIINNVFANNTGNGNGGVIFAVSSNDSAIFIGNIIANNTCTNMGGVALFQTKSTILLNNTIVGNTSGLYLQENQILAINNIIAHNGTASDSVQVRLGDSLSATSNFYSCCLEFGVNKFVYGRYPLSGTASGIISTYPNLISKTIPNPFGYIVTLPVFPTSISNTNNQGMLNLYLTTLSTSDIIGTSWTKDDSVDIGAIQYNQDIVAVKNACITLRKVRNSNYRKCDLLGRSFDKVSPNTLLFRNNIKKVLSK